MRLTHAKMKSLSEKEEADVVVDILEMMLWFGFCKVEDWSKKIITFCVPWLCVRIVASSTGGLNLWGGLKYVDPVRC